MLLVAPAGAGELGVAADPTPAPPIVGPGVQTFPNVGGGEDIVLPSGEVMVSDPNIEGGRDYRLPDGRSVTCVPNIAGGIDCR